MFRLGNRFCGLDFELFKLNGNDQFYLHGLTISTSRTISVCSTYYVLSKHIIFWKTLSKGLKFLIKFDLQTLESKHLFCFGPFRPYQKS